MFNFLSYFKKRKNYLKKEFCRDSNGNPVVEVKIDDKSEVIAPFAVDGKLSINVEFANLLDNLGKSLSPKENLQFNIKCDSWSDDEKFDVASAIKHYYFNSLIQMERKLRNNLRLFWIMVAFSVIFVATLFLADYFGAPFIVTEVIDIIVWGFVWEAVDLATFQRSLFQHEYDHSKVIYNMKITFV